MNRASCRAAGFSLKLALGAGIVVAFAGCGNTLPVGSGGARIELQGNPMVTFDPNSGKTTVVLAFLVRDGNGNPLDPGSTAMQRYVNGQLADVESVANLQDTRISSNLTLGLVLDASYSMTTSQPPAFTPMKQAASSTLQQIRNQFASWNAGTFTPVVSWFQDKYVCVENPTPPSTSMPDSAILQIPVPQSGDSTKLWAATALMADRLKQIHDAAPNLTVADHFAMVVFTDGFDNYSWYDSTNAPPASYLADGGSFSCAGVASMTALDALTSKLQAFPDLKVYVIGLGGSIKVSELSAIATAGHGRFVSNPDTGQVASLFADVTREFTTVRRDGITMPLQPGDYEYVEQVGTGSGTARVSFRFHAGDGNAAVDPRSISQ